MSEMGKWEQLGIDRAKRLAAAVGMAMTMQPGWASGTVGELVAAVLGLDVLAPAEWDSHYRGDLTTMVCASLADAGVRS